MKITLEAYEHKLSYETNRDDLTSTELLDIFKRLMIGITYSEDVVMTGMKELLEEYEDSDN